MNKALSAFFILILFFCFNIFGGTFRFNESMLNHGNLNIIYDPASAHAKVEFKSSQNEKILRSHYLGVESQEQFNSLIDQLSATAPISYFYQRLKSQMKSVESSCHINIDTVPLQLQITELNNSWDKLDLNQQVSHLLPHPSDSIILENDIVNLKIVPFTDQKNEIKHLRIYSDNVLLHNQPLQSGSNSISFMIKNAHHNISLNLSGQVDSRNGGSLFLQNLVYGHNGTAQDVNQQVIHITPQANNIAVTIPQKQNVEMNEFYRDMYHDKTPGRRRVLRNFFDNSFGTLFWRAKDRTRLVANMVEKKVLQEKMITDLIPRNRIRELAYKVARDKQFSKSPLKNIPEVTAYANEVFVNEMVFANFKKFLPPNTSNERIVELTNSVTIDFKQCLENTKSLDSKTRNKAIEVCMNKFKRSGPVKIGELLLRSELRKTLKDQFKNNHLTNELEVKAVDQFRMCAKEHAINAPEEMALKYVQACIYKSILLVFSEGVNKYIKGSISSAIKQKSNRAQLANGITFNIKNCLAQQRLLTNQGQPAFQNLLNVEMEQFKSALLQCGQSVTDQHSPQIVESIMESDTNFKNLTQNYPLLKDQIKDIAINKGLAQCKSKISSKNPLICKDYIMSVTENGAGALIADKTIKDLTGPQSNSYKVFTTSLAPQLNSCLQANENDVLYALDLQNKYPERQSEVWENNKNDLASSGFTYNIDKKVIEVDKLEQKSYQCFKTTLKDIIPKISLEIFSREIQKTLSNINLSDAWIKEHIQEPVLECYGSYLDKFQNLKQLSPYLKSIQQKCIGKMIRHVPTVLIPIATKSMLKDIISPDDLDHITSQISDSYGPEKLDALFSNVSDISELAPKFKQLRNDLSSVSIKTVQGYLLKKQIDNPTERQWLQNKLDQKFTPNVIGEYLKDLNQESIQSLTGEILDYVIKSYMERMISKNFSDQNERAQILDFIQAKYNKAKRSSYFSGLKNSDEINQAMNHFKEDIIYDLIHQSTHFQFHQMLGNGPKTDIILTKLKDKYSANYIKDILRNQDNPKKPISSTELEKRLHHLKTDVANEGFEITLKQSLDNYFRNKPNKSQESWLNIEKKFPKSERISILQKLKPAQKLSNAVDQIKQRSIYILFDSLVTDTIENQIKSPNERQEILSFIKSKYNEEYISSKLEGVSNPQDINKRLKKLQSDVIHDVVNKKLSIVLEKQVPSEELKDKIREKLQEELPKERIGQIISEADKNGNIDSGIQKIIELSASILIDELTKESLNKEILKIGLSEASRDSTVHHISTELKNQRDLTQLTQAFLSDDPDTQVTKFKDFTTLKSMRTALPVILDTKFKELDHLIAGNSQKVRDDLEKDILSCLNKIETDLKSFYSNQTNEPINVLERSNNCNKEAQKRMMKTLVHSEIKQSAGALFKEGSKVSDDIFNLVDRKINYCFEITEKMSDRMNCAIYASLPASRKIINFGLDKTKELRGLTNQEETLSHIFQSCLSHDLIAKISDRTGVDYSIDQNLNADEIDLEILKIANKEKNIDLNWLKNELKSCVLNVLSSHPDDTKSILGQIKNSFLGKIKASDSSISEQHTKRLDSIIKNALLSFQSAPGQFYEFDLSGLATPTKAPSFNLKEAHLDKAAKSVAQIFAANPENLLNTLESFSPSVKKWLKENSVNNKVNMKDFVNFILEQKLTDEAIKSAINIQLESKIRTSLRDQDYPFKGLAATGPSNLIYGVDGKLVERITSPQTISRIFESRMSDSEKRRRLRLGKPLSIKEVLVKNVVKPTLSGKKVDFSKLPATISSQINEIILLDKGPGSMVDLIMDEMIQLKINRKYRASSFSRFAGLIGYDITARVNDFSWKQLKRKPSGQKVARIFRDQLMPVLLKPVKSNVDLAKIEKYQKEMEKLISKAQGENK